MKKNIDIPFFVDGQTALDANNLNKITNALKEVNLKSSENASKIQEISENLVPDSSGEVIAARQDYVGVVHENLSARLESDYLKIQENPTSREVFLDFAGIGNISVENTVNGKTRDLKILGNTVGGYDEINATSAPITSSGQVEGKILVKSCGKNLCDNSKNEDGKFLMADGYLSDQPTSITDYIKVKNNTIYAFSGEGNRLFVGKYNKDKEFIERIEISNVQGNLNVGDSSYVRICMLNNGQNYQIELGTIATDYEPYQDSVVEIQLPESMVESGFQKDDYIRAGVNGFIEIVQDKEKDVITNLNDIQLDGNLSETVRFKIKSLKRAKTDTIVLSNSYTSKVNYYSNDNNLYAGHPDDGFFLSRLNSEISTVDELKRELAINNLEVVYQLETPIIHQTTIPNSQLNLTTFHNMTHTLSLNSTPCGMEYKAPVDVPQFIAAMKRESINQKKETEKLKDGTLLLVNTFISILSPMILPTEIKENILLENLINYKNSLS